ncbi:chromosome partitioning protein [Cellulomonas fengjieae]|uniref:Chromosome partitioning protein n=1 Tax=Cellulomonas fengjieae TaxID=2819978 RepID=A0ABS3SHF4_9CELL|nr:chromosome partitioning protein [Cellulomonas fengjieae]MBO3085082.1 chromosome partitioning protein [Cellulomonas fengjieae]QVI66332.1 chromosome partitioning protein [Cellulomonas fengjieae]
MSDASDGSDGTPVTTKMPDIRAEVRDDGTGEISIDGVVERVRMANLAEAGAAITTRIAALAGTVGRPVPVQVRDPDGVWSLMIHPDGLVDEAPALIDGDGSADGPADRDGSTGAVSSSQQAAFTGGDSAAPSVPATLPPLAEGTPSTPARGPAATRGSTSRPTGASADEDGVPASGGAGGPAATVGTGSGSTPLPTLDDLLAARHPVPASGPAEHGWRAGVRRLTFGVVSPAPGPVERRRRVDSASVRRTLDGPKTVVVINPKGGAHKTTATMLLAATFGLQRGGYTLAWDNNETRGTLGWRSSHADHTRTAVDLLNALPSLGPQGTVRIGDLDGFVRTQPSEQFDVLASDENSASASSVDADSFTALHQVLSRFYRVLVIDTGNNMRASNWQAAVGAADQIVVVSTVREDTAQSAAWALDALRATGHEEAVRRAVTVLSAPEPKVDKDLQKRLRSHFGALTRAVIDVPHDRALVSGGPIDYDSLDLTTRDAWLRVTAVVADGL